MTLNELHETLLNMPNNSLTDALFIILDYMSEAGDGNCSYSHDNIGIDVTNNCISICDIESGKDIAVLKLIQNN